MELQEEVKQLIRDRQRLGYTLQELGDYLVRNGIPAPKQYVENLLASNVQHPEEILQAIKDTLSIL